MGYAISGEVLCDGEAISMPKKNLKVLSRKTIEQYIFDQLEKIRFTAILKGSHFSGFNGGNVIFYKKGRNIYVVGLPSHMRKGLLTFGTDGSEISLNRRYVTEEVCTAIYNGEWRKAEKLTKRFIIK